MGFLDEISPQVLQQLTSGSYLRFRLDKKHHLSQIEMLNPSPLTALPGTSAQESAFSATILPHYSFASALLRQFYDQDKKTSQCYDRAHVWTYFSLIKHGVHLPKMWLFFADHYIRAYRFKWWFHVAPYALVNMRGQVNERIMDRKFFSYPLKVKLWTDLFMENKNSCKEVELYTDYSEHPDENDCYLIRSTPYFWQPRDLERYAKKGTDKKDYVLKEVNYSYYHAFGLERDTPGAKPSFDGP